MKRGLFILIFLICILFISGQQGCEPTIQIGKNIQSNSCCVLSTASAKNCINDISSSKCDSLYSLYKNYYISSQHFTNLANSCSSSPLCTTAGLSCNYQDSIYQNGQIFCLESSDVIYKCENGKWISVTNCKTNNKECYNKIACSNTKITKTLCSMGSCGGTACTPVCNYASSCATTGTDSACGLNNACVRDVTNLPCEGGICSSSGSCNPVNLNNIGSITSLVYSLAPYGEKLYAASGSIYSYDGGTGWTLTTYSPNGRSIVLYSDGISLFAGLEALNAGNPTVYKYDGSSWTNLGIPGGDYNRVYSLAKYNGKLYAGTINGVYSYESGTTWTPFYVVDYAIQSMIVYNNQLYISRGINVYKYTGSEWVDVGLPGLGSVTGFALHNNKLYAQVVGDVYVYNGETSWIKITTNSLNAGELNALYDLNGVLYLIGWNNIYGYNEGYGWVNVKGGSFKSMSLFNDKLYVGNNLGNIYSI